MSPNVVFSADGVVETGASSFLARFGAAFLAGASTPALTVAVDSPFSARLASS